jgi:lipid-A-disaccharide synthase-like uncharacterized protein
MSRLLLQRNGLLAHVLAGCHIGCYGDLSFKQRVVIQCLVAEKELVTKIYKI